MSCQCERLDCQFAIQCADNPPPSSSSETFFVQARCQQILKEGETHVVLRNRKQRETSNSQSEKDQRGECIRCSTYTRIQLTAESRIKDHVIRKLLCVYVCVFACGVHLWYTRTLWIQNFGCFAFTGFIPAIQCFTKSLE